MYMNVCVGIVDDLHTSSVSERSSGVNTFLKKNCLRDKERERVSVCVAHLVRFHLLFSVN